MPAKSQLCHLIPAILVQPCVHLTPVLTSLPFPPCVLCLCSPAFVNRTLQLDVLQQDPTRPVLLLGGAPSHPGPAHGSKAVGSGYQLRLIPCITPSTFPLPRLGPDRNSVRWAVRVKAAPSLKPDPAQPGDAPTTPGSAGSNAVQPIPATATANEHPTAGAEGAALAPLLPPTPVYNAGIVADMCVLAHAALLQHAQASLPSFSDTLLLLKVG